MNVSLDQAIEIHAKALRHRFGPQAPVLAKEKAGNCSASGDHKGENVWLRVAALAEALRQTSTAAAALGRDHAEDRPDTEPGHRQIDVISTHANQRAEGPRHTLPLEGSTQRFR
jgi:hypothetical protein